MNPLQTSLILPPALETYDRSSVVTFLKEWNIYASRVNRYNNATTPDRRLSTVPVRECIDRSIVYTIVTFDLEPVAEVNEDTVPDQTLLDHLSAYAGTAWSSAIDVTELFKPLRFTHYEDPLQSVHEIFADSRSILSDHGLVIRFEESSDLREEQIKAIIRTLHPQSLRDSIMKSMSIDRIDCKDNLRLFYKFLLETLKSFRLFNTVNSYSAKPQIANNPRFICFFCHGPHHVRQCPECGPEEATRLLLDHRNRNTIPTTNIKPSSNVRQNAFPRDNRRVTYAPTNSPATRSTTYPNTNNNTALHFSD